MTVKLIAQKILLISAAVLAIACFHFAFTALDANAASFTVNSTEDNTDGSCDHPFLSDVLDCTLREAIELSNSTPGADAITFDIDSSFEDDGDGQWVIEIDDDLPAISETAYISASSLWDTSNDRPGVRLDGDSDISALSFSNGSTGSTLQGLEISNFERGVSISDTGITIGVDCDGAYDTQERNVIYNSDQEEIFINNTSNSIVRGNYIGVLNDGLSPETSSGTFAVRIYGADADDNLIGFEEGTSSTCSPALQRNIIGVNGSDSGVYVDSDAGTHLTGNEDLAPDRNYIQGNYIGVGADGVTDIAIDGRHGVDLLSGATFNYVGTNGNGIDDEYEGNVIGNWNRHGVFVFKTGNNRISGNIVGVGADGSSDIGNTSHGILIRGEENIVGWCDTSVNSTICSDSGLQEDQANTTGFNASNGIRVGANCDNCHVYGNYVGTDSELNNLGNIGAGIFVHPGLTGVSIGGPTEDHGNIVAFNEGGGISIDGLFCYGNNCSNDREPTDDFLVQNNLVTQNELFGIQILGTDVSSTGEAGEGEVLDNIVQENNGVGINLEASSPTVSSNTLENNETYGILVSSGYNDPTYELPASNESGTYNPPETSISSPTITDNTISSSDSGGILIINADPENQDTIYNDNTFSSNENFSVRKDTYFAVNLDNPGDPDLTDDSVVVRLNPYGELSCTGNCSGDSYSESESGEVLWGPEGINYDDPRTWFQVTDFEVDESGEQEEYGPYMVSVSGNVIAEYSTPIETAENGDSATEAEVSVHYPSSSANGIFYSEPIVLVPNTNSETSSESVSVQDTQSSEVEDSASETESASTPSLPDLPEVGGGTGIVQLESYVYFAQPFSLVKTEISDTVYMIDIDQSRRPFMNTQIFFTWYEDFRFVRVISNEEMASIPVGPPMLPRPGITLVKLHSDTKVYAIEPTMIVRHIPSETQAMAIYGDGWQSLVMDLEPYLFTRYSIGAPLETNELPTGLLATNNRTTCYIYFGWCNEITENALHANRLKPESIYTPTANIEALPVFETINERRDALLTDRLPVTIR